MLNLALKVPPCLKLNLAPKVARCQPPNQGKEKAARRAAMPNS